MATKTTEGYLALHGESLAENGYQVIPIAVGTKKPVFRQWSHIDATVNTVADWLSSGMGHNGVGIITKHTPAIDIDVGDAALAQRVEDWCLEHLGPAPIRYGREPRRLLVYRTEEPFPKQKSAVFADEWGDKNHVEALGDGQQFVAYADHPDTGRPYRWATDDHPAVTLAAELTTISLEQIDALLNFFEKLAAEEGWKKLVGRQAGRGANPDDPFADVESAINISEDELHRKLMTVPGSEDYDTWMQVGMALFHQFDGQDSGFDLWNEWSATAENYDEDALKRHWKSFDISGKGRAPVTARFIIKLAKEAEERAALVELATLRGGFRSAQSESDWNAACAAVRKSAITAVARSELTALAKETYQRITGGKIALVPLRQALAYDVTKDGIPAWCREWVYDTSDDKFVNRSTKIVLTMQGFNAANCRQALTKKDILDGRTTPSAPASDLALNVHRIPIVNGRMFAPGEDVIFTEDGKTWINTYRDDLAPEMPATLSSKDRLSIVTVEKHIAHLLPDPREQSYLLNWLAFTVQNPGELVKWAILLQGTEGDGKSFFMFLLRAVMGAINVRPVNASTLEHQFTDWAHGQQIVFIEEARMLGHGGADVLNKIKPNITNESIEIHPKGRAPYWVRNTSNYFITTNFKNALPITDNDRRYCVLFSQWQSKEDLDEFIAWNPGYYRRLYNTLIDSPGALRKWLMRHDIPDSFPAGDRAPTTKAHKAMADAATPAFIRDMRQIISEGNNAFISKDLVSITELNDLLSEFGTDIPETRTQGRLLELHGYGSLGRVRIGERRHTFYTKTPEMFPDIEAIKRHVKRMEDELGL